MNKKNPENNLCLHRQEHLPLHINEQYTDEELLARLGQNDEGAFRILYARYWKQLYSTAFMRLQDHDIVKDILQDIFLQVWLRRATLQINNLEAYLHTAVRNRVLKSFELEGRYTPLETLFVELGQSSSNADVLVLRSELRKSYEAVLATLTPSQKRILSLRYEQDLNTEEIARKMDITRKTVQNQLRSALIQIRSSILSLGFLILLKSFF